MAYAVQGILTIPMQKVLTRFEQFIRDAKGVRMRTFERYAIRERLIMQMEVDRPTILPAAAIRRTSRRRIAIAIFASICVIALGSGAALALSIFR